MSSSPGRPRTESAVGPGWPDVGTVARADVRGRRGGEGGRRCALTSGVGSIGNEGYIMPASGQIFIPNSGEAGIGNTICSTHAAAVPPCNGQERFYVRCIDFLLKNKGGHLTCGLQCRIRYSRGGEISSFKTIHVSSGKLGGNLRVPGGDHSG